jgi:hypothetical protein
MDTDAIPEHGSSAGIRLCTKCARSRPSYHDICAGVLQIKCKVCGKVLAVTGRVKELQNKAAEVYNRGRRARR